MATTRHQQPVTLMIVLSDQPPLASPRGTSPQRGLHTRRHNLATALKTLAATYFGVDKHLAQSFVLEIFWVLLSDRTPSSPALRRL